MNKLLSKKLQNTLNKIYVSLLSFTYLHLHLTGIFYAMWLIKKTINSIHTTGALFRFYFNKHVVTSLILGREKK